MSESWLGLVVVPYIEPTQLATYGSSFWDI